MPCAVPMTWPVRVKYLYSEFGKRWKYYCWINTTQSRNRGYCRLSYLTDVPRTRRAYPSTRVGTFDLTQYLCLIEFHNRAYPPSKRWTSAVYRISLRFFQTRPMLRKRIEFFKISPFHVFSYRRIGGNQLIVLYHLYTSFFWGVSSSLRPFIRFWHKRHVPHWMTFARFSLFRYSTKYFFPHLI